MNTWQLQAAKARLSELLRDAQDQGPQEITVHGRSVAVVLSRACFDRLSGGSDSLVAFMRQSPLYDAPDLVFERDGSLVREVDLGLAD